MTPVPRKMLLVMLATLAVATVGCRGDLSEDPPIHLNPNMDNQERLDPQESYRRFGDHRAMRRSPPGTVAVGGLKTDRHLHEGKIGNSYASYLPPAIRLSPALVARGRERFNIYCANCHDRMGTGRGFVYRVNAGLPRPVSFHDRRMRAATVGEIVHTMTFGKGNMPALGFLIPARDRWAIVAYIRALQLSQDAQPAKQAR